MRFEQILFEENECCFASFMHSLKQRGKAESFTLDSALPVYKSFARERIASV